MKALIHYLLQNYLRSYLYIPPVTIFIIWTVVSYTYTPNPILSSYAIASAVLYFITAWISLTLLNVEDNVQQHITIVHSKGIVKIFCGKVFSVLCFSFVLSLFAIIYPVLAGAFARMPNTFEFFISFISLMLVSLLSLSIVSLFHSFFQVRTISSWLLLSLLLAISLAKSGIENVLPNDLSFITWPLPPVLVILTLLEGDVVTLDIHFVLNWIYVFSYALILLFISFVIIRNQNGWKFLKNKSKND